MKTKQILLSLALGLLAMSNLQAQNLVLKLHNGTNETFAVEEIRSIKFGVCTMIINKINDDIHFWYFDDIQSYAFDGVTNVSEKQLSTNTLEIYPNPSMGNFHINYQNDKTEDIQIILFNINGKAIATIYEGQHDKENQYFWNGSIPKGMYFVRLISPSNVNTQRIVIQ
jgi:hypothetical protein